jgi:3-hydroxy-9,10-secoandrosta-1,3,5(10)-triene-9,17-dione monooxygenase
MTLRSLARTAAAEPRAQARDGAEIGRAAAQLVPVLRDRVEQAESVGRMPDATVSDIRRLMLARILQPAVFGGLELPLSSMVDVLVPVASGCGATAWSLAQYIMHNYMLARWPAEAQRAVWGPTPDALLAGILIPGLGKARPVPGGYVVSGRWPFVTGVDTSDWCMLSAMSEEAGGEARRELYFVVPTADLAIHPTWTGFGLAASASNDIEVRDMMVPDTFTVSIDDLKGGDFPGKGLHPQPLYAPPVYMCFGILLASAVLGMARGMLDDYVGQARRRIGLMSGKDVAGFATQHVKIGEAASALDAAEAVLRRDCDRIHALADTGVMPDDATRTGFRSNATFAGNLAWRAASLVWDVAGARAAYAHDPIGRVYRDIAVATRHVTQNPDINWTEHGRARLGLPMTNPSL